MSKWVGYDKVHRITAADDYDYLHTFDKVPDGQRIIKAWLTIKQDLDDPDAAALYQVAVTTTPDADGNRIVADGSAKVIDESYGVILKGNTLTRWLLPRSETVTWPLGPDLPFDVRFLASSGLEAQIARGVFRVTQRATQAT